MSFLNIHMRYLGLNIQEVTWINSALPLTALVGPPMVGLLADKLGHYRPITIVCMLLATFLHAALLFVPSCKSVSTREATLSLHCSTRGATLQVDSCHTSCEHPVPLLPAAFQVDECQVVCEEASGLVGDSVNVGDREATMLEAEAGTEASTEASMRLLLQLRTPLGDSDYVPPMEKQVILHFNSSLIPLEEEERIKEEEEEEKEEAMSTCSYPVENFTYFSTQYSSMSCNTIEPHCLIMCNVTKRGNETQLLDTSSCCNARLTLWLYFGLRALAEMFSAILVSLLEAVALTMVHQHNGDYGREKMFGLLAVAIFSPLCGYLVDSKVGTFGYSYAPVFYVFVSLMLVTVVVTLALPIQVQAQRRSLMKNMIQLILTESDRELSVLLILMTVLGTFWGYLKTFVYLYLEDLHATKLLIGLTSSFCILPSLPFLYRSGAVVQFCGHHYLIMLAFVGYCIRFAGLSYISNPWWVLLLESLELFTLNLLNVSAATLAYKLAPKSFVATAQALVWVSHFNIGRCIGTFVGGHLLALYGDVPVFQGAAVMAATCAAVYLASHQLIKHLKARREARPKPSPARENGNVPNGHYAPLQLADERF
ncbi:Major facilitator superfamily domain-containing protein 6-A [Chionoecetes opilio]|uniref:Major facilitator superfamily domain-containing protein 6-A n=1 Tax=Chionoecetes opilio TaxID=41210 RepID=A0A8J5CTV8_CHIOP|nr:Major facilitator superfamily domain-containing protein 6-A [Chionoecetes opilio]